ncbi:hypothetical protein D9758_019128, partial [Tetrapyrgos nigripes]
MPAWQRRPTSLPSYLHVLSKRLFLKLFKPCCGPFSIVFMSNPYLWRDTDGYNTLKSIVSRCILQWPSGLHDYQAQYLPLLLDKGDILLVTATGDGKSTFFIVPILAHLEIRSHPDLYLSQFTRNVKEHPVGIVITPTKGLAASIVAELAEFGLSGISLCRETIADFRLQGVDYVKLVCACQTWQVILVDPEHLTEPEWHQIFQHKTFIRNLVYFCIEEVHLIHTWGVDFRIAFSFIGRFARSHLPETVPILGLSATCPPGRSTNDICTSLGLRPGAFTLVGVP